jgi:hypothetical protein
VPSKKSRKRRKRKRSKLPLLVVAVLAAAAGGYLWWDAREPTPDSVGLVTTTIANDSNTVTTIAATTDPSGTVAPPVAVHNDTLGDIDGDTVYDDYTRVSPPPRGSTLSVDPSQYAGEFIEGVLADGVYEAFAHGVFDEDVRGINFDIGEGDDETHLYPAFLDTLIFVSINEDADTNLTVNPTTFFDLVRVADERVMAKPMVVTVIDGAIVAAEGIAIG